MPLALASIVSAHADAYLGFGGAGNGYETPANWFSFTAAAYPGATSADVAGFIDGASPAITATLANPVTLASWFFNTTTTSYTIDGGKTVNLSLGIVNNSTGGTHTIANNITGAGGITQNGAGSVLVLSGLNSYTGATTISAGTLRVRVSLSASSALTIAAGATLDTDFGAPTVASLAGAGTIIGTSGITFGGDNSSTTFSGNFSAGANLTKQGSGTFTFSGDGGTPVAGGVFDIKGGTFVLSGAANVANIGMLVEPGTTLDISGTNSGASILYLASAAGTAIHLGSKTLTVNYGLGLGHSFNTSSFGVIDGSGGLTVATDTTLSLQGVNTFTGPTTLTTATSQIQARVGNALATSSEVNIAASGAIFSIANAPSDVSIQSLRGVAGSNVIAGDNNLILTNAAADFAGVIKKQFNNSTGGLILTGGHQTLSGINTYTGATAVNGGTLSINGSIATSVMTTVNTGGTLGGIGTVGNTTVNGGTLSPGNSIGTLTIQGNLVLSTAASYIVQVSGATSDKTVVTGTASLAGTLVVQPDARITAPTTYTILTSAGTTGTFQSAIVSNPGFARVSQINYIGGSVLLTLDAGLLSLILPTSATGNQKNVAAAIDNALLAGANLPAGFNRLLGLSGPALTNALTQISGETATGSQQTTFNAMNLFMGVMTDPFLDGRGGSTASPGATGYAGENAMAYAANRNPNDALAAIHTKAPRAVPFEARWSVWAAGYGGSQTTDGNAAVGSNTATSRVYGTAVGADYRISPDTLAGFALAGGGTNFSVANAGTGRSDLFQAGAFIRHVAGPAYITAALAYGWQDVTTDRTVTVAGIDRLRAQFNANAWSGRVEGGYRFVTQGFGLTPYAAAQFTTFELPNHAESVVSGANTFALGFAAKTVTAARSEFGLRSDRSFAMQDAVLTLRGRAAWAHDFNPDRSIAATFQSLPGASFVVNGAGQARDAALTTASAEMKWMSGFSLAATFEGEFSAVTRSYAGKGVARHTW